MPATKYLCFELCFPIFCPCCLRMQPTLVRYANVILFQGKAVRCKSKCNGLEGGSTISGIGIADEQEKELLS
jgi:hypothetical protein